MAEEKTKAASFEAGQAIYDATTLGTPRMVVLGLQHMFAMFGATVLVPLITGLDVSTTLLFAGLGTLLFHFITKMKVPAFLGSSFAFLGGYAAITGLADESMTQAQLLPYACFGVACAGLVYLILAAVIRAFGTSKVMRYVPPVVTGPIIVAIGLGLSGSAVANCQENWLVAFSALVVVIMFNIWGIGMMRIIPIIMGVIVSYIVAILCHDVDFAPIKEAAWIGSPIHWSSTVFGGVDFSNSSLVLTAIIAIVPIALATMMEHIGDISAIGATVGKNYIADPGLHRTLTGDGLATTIASLFGAPANTTYGENTGVLALTKVYDPKVIRGHHPYHPDRDHRRYLLRPLRYDLRRRSPEHGRVPCRLLQEPEPHHRGCHPGLCPRHDRWSDLPHRQRRHHAFRSGRRLHRRHPAQRHPSGQRLCFR